MVLSIVFGFLTVAIAVLLGDCGAFGGRCPAEPPRLLDDDVFRIAAMGAALMVGPTTFLLDPGVKRLWLAIGVAVAAGIVVGLVGRSMAYS